MTIAQAIQIANTVSQTAPPATPVADPPTAEGLNQNSNQSQQLAQAVILLANAITSTGSATADKGQRFGDTLSTFPTVSNTTVETRVGEVTIPANTLQAGSVVQVIYSGKLSNGTGGPATCGIRVGVDAIPYQVTFVTQGAGSSSAFTSYVNISILDDTTASQTNPILLIDTGINAHDQQSGIFTFEILTDSDIFLSFDWDVADPTVIATLTNRQVVAFP